MKTSILALTVATILATNAHAAEGLLRVGAAKVDETGPFGPSQSGKYDHEHVYARAIVLDNGKARSALISYDGPERDFDMAATIKAVSGLVDCPPENIVITHTHTHSGSSAPMTFPGQTPDPTEPSKKILDAAKMARANLQPARMAYDTGKLYLNVNRDAIDPITRKWAQESNLDAPSDKTVGVLQFLKPDGNPIAVYVTYAMHPINGYVLGIVSGDFPEAMSRYVEKAFGDKAIVEFSQSPSGDQMPLYLRPSNNAMASRAGNTITGFEMNREASEGPLRMADAAAAQHKGKGAPPADPKIIDAMFRFIESQGQVFGEEVIRVMSAPKAAVSDVRISGAEKIVSCPGRTRVNGDAFDPSTREGMKASYKDTPPLEIHVGVLGLGTVALASIGGEVYTLIGERIMREAPMKNTIIATIANLRVGGYIPDDASYGHETFQVLNSYLKPGCAERGITDAIVSLENDYLSER